MFHLVVIPLFLVSYFKYSSTLNHGHPIAVTNWRYLLPL